MHDLAIQNGRLIDPAQNLDAPRDVAFTDGQVVAVTKSNDTTQANEIIDAQDLLVVPGLIDLHVHVFDAVSHYGIPPIRPVSNAASPPPSTPDRPALPSGQGSTSLS